MKKKWNIKIVTLLQLAFIILMYVVCALMCQSSLDSMIIRVIDMPSLIMILMFIILGLAISGSWKDFRNAFSVGTKTFTLKELKNMNESVALCRKLILYGGIFTSITAIIEILSRLDLLETIGPNLAVAILTIFYAMIFELLLLPVSIALQREINEVMSFEEMD